MSLVGHRLLCTLVALGLSASGSAFAQARAEVRDVSMGQDRFVAGDQATIGEAVQGDLVAAGRDVDITATTDGDVIAAGRSVRLAGSSRQDVYAAGGEVRIAGKVDRNARLAGGTVLIEDTSAIQGNVSVAGGDIDVVGEVGGYLQAAGGEIFLNGSVRGDVVAAGRHIELGPNANIAGSLRYESPAELIQATGARVAGGIDRAAVEAGTDGMAPSWIFWAWTIGLMILGAALASMLPRFSRHIADTTRSKFGRSLLLGLAALVLVPIAVLIAAITVVGLPIGVVLVLSYFLLLLIGYVFAGIALGEISLQWFRKNRQDSRAMHAFAAAIALLLLGLLSAVPFLGALVMCAALLVGMGALLFQLRPAPVATPSL